MKVLPLAADSLGVRSMATYVEVGDTGILIDPGATLAASRFNLPPADEEWEALRRANDRISTYAGRAAFVFVSHYHEEHFRSDPASYAGRTVLLKDPHRMVRGLQARRAAELMAALAPHATVEMADGYERREAVLQLRVSPPLAHGVEGTSFGYVVALTIVDPAERERFVFASDVQGPLSAVAAAYLIKERPTLLYLSGPPSYVERQIGATAIDRGIDNLLRVLDATGCRVIMDHHAVRDAAGDVRLERLWETGRVTTAAAFLGLPEARLEARRAELWARVRKPAAKAAPAKTAAANAIMPVYARRLAKGGHA